MPAPTLAGMAGDRAGRLAPARGTFKRPQARGATERRQKQGQPVAPARGPSEPSWAVTAIPCRWHGPRPTPSAGAVPPRGRWGTVCPAEAAGLKLPGATPRDWRSDGDLASAGPAPSRGFASAGRDQSVTRTLLATRLLAALLAGPVLVAGDLVAAALPDRASQPSPVQPHSVQLSSSTCSYQSSCRGAPQSSPASGGGAAGTGWRRAGASTAAARDRPAWVPAWPPDPTG